MELTPKQELYNKNPMYWEWFKTWWEEDYTWDGLKDKTNFSGEPLQEYYKGSSKTPSLISAFGKEWCIVNLPPHNLEGDILKKETSHNYYIDKLRSFIVNNNIEELHGCVFEDQSMSMGKPVKCKFSRTNAVINKNISVGGNNAALLVAEKCFVEKITNNSVTLKDCYITDKVLNLANQQNQTIEIKDSIFDQKFKINSQRQNKVVIENVVAKDELIVTATNVDIRKPKTSKLVLMHTDLPNENNEHSIILDKRCSTQVEYTGKPHSSGSLVISAGSRSSLKVLNADLKSFEIRSDNMNVLSIKNSKISSNFKLAGLKLNQLHFSNSDFLKGILALNLECYEPSRILGVTVLSSLDCTKAKFHSGLDIGSFDLPDGNIRDSVVVAATFRRGLFSKLSVGEDNPPGIIALDFSNTKFKDSFDFDKVEIDGVPLFVDTKLPPNSSFNDLKPNQGLLDKTATEGQYTKYISAFRLCRQIMERNGNFVEAYKFGRLETIAKEYRGKTNDVSLTEIWLTRCYGLISDYGQSLFRPLASLVVFFFFFWGAQALIISMIREKCWVLSKNCKIDFPSVALALDRATTFTFPPFSALAKKSAPSFKAENSPSISTHNEITVFESGFAESAMLAHGIIASISLFLFLLAVKRRMQFK